MPRLRFITVFAAAVVASASLPAAQQAATAQSGTADLTESIHDLGVCGPIFDPILSLVPQTAGGGFDFEAFVAGPNSAGQWRITVSETDELGLSLSGIRPDALDLYEFNGRLQAVAFTWQGLDTRRPRVFKTGARYLKRALGKPASRERAFREWVDEPLRVMIWETEESNATTVLVGCLASEDAYHEARQAADTTEPAETEASQTGNEGFGPNPWLDRGLADVLLSFGVPDGPPMTPADNVVGLHYIMKMGDDDVPTEWWWWFIDGTAVYAAGDFLPPRGSKRARSSYVGFRKTIRGFFGEPSDDGRDPETGTERIVYETGPQLFILTYFDPDGDPWFRIESFDATRLDELPAEVRPNRKLPKRFTPPPKDSGLTREDVTGPAGVG